MLRLNGKNFRVRRKLLNNNKKSAASQLKTTGDAQHVNVG